MKKKLFENEKIIVIEWAGRQHVVIKEGYTYPEAMRSYMDHKEAKAKEKIEIIEPKGN